MKVFYTPRMVADAGMDSPSPRKPPLVVEGWRAAGIPLEIEEPEPATVEDLSLVHGRVHVHDILAGYEPNGFGTRDMSIAASLPYTAGAMAAAASWAVEHGSAAAAPCSGFHHAETSRAMMFCTFNGLMVAARKLQVEGRVTRVGILDCDQHFGNGTEDIIARLDARGWVHHVTAEKGYARDASFLERLPEIVEGFRDCDVMLYQAGADPHMDDPLGGFLTTEELAMRDEMVFAGCREMGLPVAWNLAGGYQSDIERVVEIHVNTARACFCGAGSVAKGGMKRFLLGIVAVVMMAGCASRYERAVAQAKATPFAGQPALYQKLRDRGDITPGEYERWMEAYNVKKNEQTALAAMSPKERAKYLLWRQDVVATQQLVALKKQEAEAVRAQEIKVRAAAAATARE